MRHEPLTHAIVCVPEVRRAQRFVLRYTMHAEQALRRALDHIGLEHSILTKPRIRGDAPHNELSIQPRRVMQLRRHSTGDGEEFRARADRVTWLKTSWTC